MLDTIIGSLKNEVAGNLTSQFGLDNAAQESVFSATKESVVETVTKQASSEGGLSGLMNLFSQDKNNDSGNAMQDMIGSALIGKLSGNSQIGAEKAGGIKDMILPVVMNLIAGKVQGKSDGISSLLGDAGSGILGNVIGNAVSDKLGDTLGGFFK